MAQQLEAFAEFRSGDLHQFLGTLHCSEKIVHSLCKDTLL